VANTDGSTSSDPQLEANKQVIRDFYGSWQSGDFDRMSELLNPEGDWWILGPRRSRKIEEQFERNRKIWNDAENGIEFTVHTLTAEEDRVAAVLESQANFVPQGSYNNLYHVLFWVRDGRIQSAKLFYDTTLAHRVLDGGDSGKPLASHSGD
jgi:uncharacterized protein